MITEVIFPDKFNPVLIIVKKFNPVLIIVKLIAGTFLSDNGSYLYRWAYCKA